MPSIRLERTSRYSGYVMPERHWRRAAFEAFQFHAAWASVSKTSSATKDNARALELISLRYAQNLVKQIDSLARNMRHPKILEIVILRNSVLPICPFALIKPPEALVLGLKSDGLLITPIAFDSGNAMMKTVDGPLKFTLDIDMKILLAWDYHYLFE